MLNYIQGQKKEEKSRDVQQQAKGNEFKQVSYRSR